MVWLKRTRLVVVALCAMLLCVAGTVQAQQGECPPQGCWGPGSGSFFGPPENPPSNINSLPSYTNYGCNPSNVDPKGCWVQGGAAAYSGTIPSCTGTMVVFLGNGPYYGTGMNPVCYLPMEWSNTITIDPNGWLSGAYSSCQQLVSSGMMFYHPTAYVFADGATTTATALAATMAPPCVGDSSAFPGWREFTSYPNLWF
jgi:hypothetical protein